MTNGLNSDVLNGTVIDFEGGFAADHHDDAQFLLALGAERFGEGGQSLQSDIIGRKPLHKALDDPALARLEIAEEQKAATAAELNYLSGLHFPSLCITIIIKQ